MLEQNNINSEENNNFDSNNNQQDSQKKYLFFLPNSEQYTENPDNKEPQMQQGQIYTPPQINNVNYQQTNPQNNINKGLLFKYPFK